MLLVVVNQNFAKSLLESGALVKEETDPSVDGQRVMQGTCERTGGLVDGEQECGDDESETDLLVVENTQSSEAQMNARFEKEVSLLLEGKEQLWKWNKLILSCMAAILSSAPGEVLAQLSLLLDRSNGEVEKLGVQRNATMLQACKKEREKWQHIAKCRSGALASNSLLVKREKGIPGKPQVYPIGSASTLLGSQRKDPLEAIRVMDNRKRGRFVKGMFQGNTPKCTLHIQTQLELSKQSKSFFLFGFEPLNAMIWERLQSATSLLEEAAKEFTETRAGYKSSGEEMDVSSPFDDEMYESLFSILHYMSICTSFLRYMREVVRVAVGESEGDHHTPHLTPPQSFQQLWQSLSNIISLSHFTQAFTILQLYLKCKEVGRRTDISIVIQFVTELLLAVQLLADGKILADPAVQTAAHALATSILYGNDTVKCLFDVLGLFTQYMMTVRHAHLLTHFTFSVFQLIDQCSFGGRLFVPKRRPHKRHRDTDGEEDDKAVHKDVPHVSVQEIVVKEETVEDAVFTRVDQNVLKSAISKSGDLGIEKADSKMVSSSTAEIVDHDLPSVITELENVCRNKDEDESSGDNSSSEGDEWNAQNGRANSEAPSHLSDGTAASSVASEREVAVSLLLQRLGTPKYIWLLVTTLRHWRTNDADMNLALVYLMESMVKEGYGHVFFHLPFLLCIREVIVHGKDTHGPLYRLCDNLAFDFFNPEFAHDLDVRVPVELQGLMTGAQSSVGFEVGLRCSRSLFCLGPVDYTLLEEKGMMPDLHHSSTTTPLTSRLTASTNYTEEPMRNMEGEEDQLMLSLKAQGLQTDGIEENQRKGNLRKRKKVNDNKDDMVLESEQGADMLVVPAKKRNHRKTSTEDDSPHRQRRRREAQATKENQEAMSIEDLPSLPPIRPEPQDLFDLEEELLLFGA